MGILDGLKPERVFYYFEKICSIPHGSYHVREISDYCMGIAGKLGLKARQDEWGNAVIWKPASADQAGGPVLMLQGHLDMVAVKNPGVAIDLERDGLSLVVEDGFIRADGTSLGADDGIAIAMILAILEDDTLSHPALEAVFTVQEEVGMEGAAAMSVDDLQSTFMLNLDCETEGQILAGCAGGACIKAVLSADAQEVSGQLYRIRIDGLIGGHSGAEIHKGRANANVLLGRALMTLRDKIPFFLVEAGGGEKDNAIPVSSSASVLVQDGTDPAVIKDAFDAFCAQFKDEYGRIEKTCSLSISDPEEGIWRVMSREDTDKVLFLLFTAPDSVQRMSQDLPGMVETSLNFAVLHAVAGEASITWSVRSILRSGKQYLLDKLCCLAKSQGFACRIYGDYPEWSFDPNSKMCALSAQLYRDLTGKEPRVEMIHAGVECSIFSEKMHGLDIVSLGPDIHDIHTPAEHLDIASAARVYELVLQILAHFPEIAH